VSTGYQYLTVYDGIGYCSESSEHSVSQRTRVERRQPAAPKSAKRAFILGLATPVLLSRLSLPMISAGVLFGAPKPKNALA
jgi:hypothetical protein